MMFAHLIKKNKFKNFAYYSNLFFKKYINNEALLIFLNYLPLLILILIDVIMITKNKNQKIFNFL